MHVITIWVPICVCLHDAGDSVDIICPALATAMQHNFHDLPIIIKNVAFLAKITQCIARHFDCIDRKCNACGSSKTQPFLTQWLHDDGNLKISFTQWQRRSDEVINNKRVKKKCVSRSFKSCYLGPCSYDYCNLVNQLAMFSEVKSLGKN